jgi:hypothetical protein
VVSLHLQVDHERNIRKAKRRLLKVIAQATLGRSDVALKKNLFEIA